MKAKKKPPMQKFTVWVEAEHWEEGQWNPVDDNSDAVVTLEDGSRWVASFFSYANVGSLAQKNKRTGACLGGKYFWATDMILVDEVTRESIKKVIVDLLAEGSFETAFSRCPDADDA